MTTTDSEFELIFNQYLTGMQNRYLQATGQTLTVSLKEETNESSEQLRTSNTD